MEKSWRTYKSDGFFDELITAKGNPRAAASQAIKFLKSLSPEELASRRVAAELAIKEMGILLRSTPRAATLTALGPSTSSLA